MADYQVQFVLTARDGATPVLQQEQRTLQQMASSTTRNASDHRRATDMMAEGNRQLGASNDDASFSFGGLENAVTGIVAGFSAYAVVQKGLELVNQGEQVHDVVVQYEAYAEALDSTTALLPKLREATLGGATDMELMAASSKLASLGLAQTDEDLTRFIAGAFRLTGSAEEVDNLAMALTNMSYVRLDTFGLSADLARKRVAELKAEFRGMGDTEAFTRAVIEQMDTKLESVGETLDEQVTNLDRFKVGWQNFWSDLSVIASDGANDVLGAVDSVINPDTSSAVAIAAEADTYLSAVAQRMIESGQRSAQEIGENNDFFVQLIRASIEAAIRNPELEGDVDAMLATIASDMQMPLMLIEDYADVVNTSMGFYLDNLHQAEAIAQTTQTFAGEGARLLSSGQGQSALVAQRMQQLAQINELEREAARLMEGGGAQSTFVDNMREHNDLIDAASMTLQQMAFEYSTITEDAGMLGDVHIVMPEDAERLDAMRSQYDYIVERAQQLADEGIISQSELESIRSGADEAARMADEMQRGADALEDMSTSDFFGTESGGLFGQLSDEVIAAARDRGLTDAQIQELQDAFDVTSGRENEASLQWRDEIIPLIVETAQGSSKTAVDDAVAALQDYIMQQGTDQFGAEAGAFLAKEDWLPTEDEIQPFDDAMSNIAINMEGSALSSDMLGMSLSGADFVAGKIVEKSGQIESHWNSLTSKIQKIQVEIDVTRLSGGPLETWLAGGITRVTRDSGGAVPGQDARLE